MNNLELLKLEHVFKILGNRKRLAMLVYLFSGHASIHQLSVALDIHYKTVERNLIQLLEAGLINKRTLNNKTYFALNDSAKNQYAAILKIIKDNCSKYDFRELAKSILNIVKQLNEFDRSLRREQRRRWPI